MLRENYELFIGAEPSFYKDLIFYYVSVPKVWVIIECFYLFEVIFIALVIAQYPVMRQVVILIYALHAKLDVDFCALAHLALGVYLAPHFLDNILADAHTEACSLCVDICMLFKLAEVCEEFV